MNHCPICGEQARSWKGEHSPYFVIHCSGQCGRYGLTMRVMFKLISAGTTEKTQLGLALWSQHRNDLMVDVCLDDDGGFFLKTRPDLGVGNMGENPRG